MAAALLLMAFGAWRVYVSALGTPDQFLRSRPAGQVEGMDRAIAKLEEMRDRAEPRSDARQEAEESLAQLRDLRAKLAEERDARVPAARWTERMLGLIALVAGMILLGTGSRRLRPGRSSN